VGHIAALQLARLQYALRSVERSGRWPHLATVRTGMMLIALDAQWAMLSTISTSGSAAMGDAY
jgi:hypothetical protein